MMSQQLKIYDSNKTSHMKKRREKGHDNYKNKSLAMISMNE